MLQYVIRVYNNVQNHYDPTDTLYFDTRLKKIGQLSVYQC